MALLSATVYHVLAGMNPRAFSPAPLLRTLRAGPHSQRTAAASHEIAEAAFTVIPLKQ
jgi:hypothetical protein